MYEVYRCNNYQYNYLLFMGVIQKRVEHFRNEGRARQGKNIIVKSQPTFPCERHFTPFSVTHKTI